MRFRRFGAQVMLVMSGVLLITGLLAPVGTTTAWTQTLSVQGTVSTAPFFCTDTAEFFITPRTLNTNSGNDAASVTVHFDGGLPGGFTQDNVHLIVMRVVLPGGGYGERTINAEPHPANEAAGIAKFLRSEVVWLLDGMTGDVTLEVSGAANGCEFAGTDTISVISPGGGPKSGQDEEKSLVPGGDEELIEGDEGLLPEDVLDGDENLVPDEQTDQDESQAPDEKIDHPHPDGDGNSDESWSESEHPDSHSGNEPVYDDEDAWQDDSEEVDGTDDAGEQDSPGTPVVEEIGEDESIAPDESSGEGETDPSDGDSQESDDAGDDTDESPSTEPKPPVPWVLPTPPVDPVEHDTSEQSGDEHGEPVHTGDEEDHSGQDNDANGANSRNEDDGNHEQTDETPAAPNDSDLPDAGHEEDGASVPDAVNDPAADNDDDEPVVPDDSDGGQDGGDSQDGSQDANDAAEEEPIVVCPIELDIRFQLDELDLADEDAELLIRIGLPEDLPETVSLDGVGEVVVAVKLGEGRYATPTATARAVSGHGLGVYRLLHGDLRTLLDDHRGEVTLEVRIEVADCDGIGTGKIVVMETAEVAVPGEAVDVLDDEGLHDDGASEPADHQGKAMLAEDDEALTDNDDAVAAESGEPDDSSDEAVRDDDTHGAMNEDPSE